MPNRKPHPSDVSNEEWAFVAPGELAQAVQEATGESVDLAYVDQGYTGERAAQEAEAHGMRLEVVKHEEAKRGFVLLPRRWVVERDFAWALRFRRLVKDYERLPTTLAGLHFVAFACLFLQQAADILSARSMTVAKETATLTNGCCIFLKPRTSIRSYRSGPPFQEWW